MFQAKKEAPAKEIIPPDGHLVERVPKTGLWHKAGHCGIKFRAYFYATSVKAVSFDQIVCREGESTKIKGIGIFSPSNGTVHTPSKFWSDLTKLYVGKGYLWHDASTQSPNLDQTGFEGGEKPFLRDFPGGTLTYDIYMMYKKKGADDSASHKYADVAKYEAAVSDKVGTAKVKKGVAGPYMTVLCAID